MNNLSNIFKAEGAQQIAGGKNQLALTARLTQESMKIAEDMIANYNTLENGGNKVLDMIDNNLEMNAEVVHYVDAEGYDNTWLMEINKDEAIKMLKSQQSKRSRAKSATMTLNTFKVMLTAAIAEELLRSTHDIARTTGGGGAKSAPLILTDEMIAGYTADQGALGKAIRNVQSKKSIMKAKADFDEYSDQYQALLTYEASLKSLRTGSAPVDTKMVEAAKKAEEVKSMVETMDITKMKKDDMAAALEQMKELMFSDAR